MYKPLIAIIITVNDILNFHGGSRSGIKKEISYFDQFLILYYSIKKHWCSEDFRYQIYLVHSIEFTEEKKMILDSIDVHTTLVNYPKHKTKIRPMAYYLNIDCDYRLVLDVDMLAMGKPKFDFSCDFQAMYGGNKYNMEQWKEICNLLECDFPNYPILKNNRGSYNDWSINEMYLYQIGKIHKKVFPYFNNGAIFIKNTLALEFVKKWEDSRELFSKYVKEKFDVDIDLEGQDVIGIVLNDISKNWKPFERGFNFPIQESFDTSKELLEKQSKKGLSLVHYINVTDNIKWSNIIYLKYLKVRRKHYKLTIFQAVAEYLKFFKKNLL